MYGLPYIYSFEYPGVTSNDNNYTKSVVYRFLYADNVDTLLPLFYSWYHLEVPLSTLIMYIQGEDKAGASLVTGLLQFAASAQ